jgi:hypothetical protein
VQSQGSFPATGWTAKMDWQAIPKIGLNTLNQSGEKGSLNKFLGWGHLYSGALRGRLIHRRFIRDKVKVFPTMPAPISLPAGGVYPYFILTTRTDLHLFVYGYIRFLPNLIIRIYPATH